MTHFFFFVFSSILKCNSFLLADTSDAIEKVSNGTDLLLHNGSKELSTSLLKPVYPSNPWNKKGIHRHSDHVEYIYLPNSEREKKGGEER